jgi:hypothetical protein
MSENQDIKKCLTELKDTSTWFWSNEFIRPHINPLLRELENSYSIVLEALEIINPDDIVAELMSLDIKMSLLLKHVMIFLDTSAETLDRAAMYINEKGITGLTLNHKFIEFKKLGPSFYKNLNNEAIFKANNKLVSDLLNILAYASQSDEFSRFETFKKCNLALIVGNKESLQEHLRYLLLRSNTQIKQLRAVDFGHQLEIYIREFLDPIIKKLGLNYSPGNRYNGQQFDKVLEKAGKHVIIEIAFQETTNSTLERKGKQAKNGLFNQVDNNGDKLVYVVDGAGYFKRYKALSDIIEYSHLTCNVSHDGLKKLEAFLVNYYNR